MVDSGSQLSEQKAVNLAERYRLSGRTFPPKWWKFLPKTDPVMLDLKRNLPEAFANRLWIAITEKLIASKKCHLPDFGSLRVSESIADDTDLAFRFEPGQVFRNWESHFPEPELFYSHPEESQIFLTFGMKSPKY